MKQCILYTEGDIVLIQKFHELAKKYHIDLIISKYLFETYNIVSQKTDVVIVMDSIQNVVNLSEVCDEIYVIKQDKIIGLTKNICYESYDKFFLSKCSSNQHLTKTEEQYLEIINNKFQSVGIVVNNWKVLFLKSILIKMKQSGINKVNNKFIKQEKINNGINCKNINLAISPILKKYAQSVCLDIKKYKTSIIIDSLYEYIFG